MKNKISIILIMLITCAFIGCDNITYLKDYYKQKKVREEKAKVPVINYIENTDLAKVILTPKVNKDFDFSRDPFRPLGKNSYMNTVSATDSGMGNVAYLGIVKMGDEFSALLQTDKNKGVYKINDHVNNNVTIVDIHEDYVMLENGEQQQYKIKRGEK